ncbi:MAG: hypothetical protein RUMPE_00058 [Eubacteriales bacterium SKADARSKE-1]|nr:hypothetical protein [Eubacteriales bacterium SKADARSKE-1]
MKKLISSILIVTTSFCSFGLSTCFAEKSSENAQQAQVSEIEQSEQYREIKEQLENLSVEIKAQKETKSENKKNNLIEKLNKILDASIGIAKFAGIGALIGAVIYKLEENFVATPKNSGFWMSLAHLTSPFSSLENGISFLSKRAAVFGLGVEILSLYSPRLLSHLIVTGVTLALNKDSLKELYNEFQKPSNNYR